MSQIKVLSILALGLIALVGKVATTCLVCSSLTSAACINQTSFAVCFNNVMSTVIGTCDPGSICTDEKGICMADDGSNIVGCNIKSPKCDQCTGPFACVSKTKFAICDADGNRGDLIVSCPTGQYCNVEKFDELKTVCVPTCLAEPTCSNTEPVTVPPPVLDWKQTCTGVPTGYYNNIYDDTCKSYVYCEMLNNVMDALLYKCSTGYFNKATLKCQDTKPAGCK